MRRARQAVKGLRPRACQVAKRLVRAMRTAEPSGLRVPPLILRVTASGRMRRSARLLSGLNPGTSTNWNSSASWRSSRLARAWHGCPLAWA